MANAGCNLAVLLGKGHDGGRNSHPVFLGQVEGAFLIGAWADFCEGLGCAQGSSLGWTVRPVAAVTGDLVDGERLLQMSGRVRLAKAQLPQRVHDVLTESAFKEVAQLHAAAPLPDLVEGCGVPGGRQEA